MMFVVFRRMSGFLPIAMAVKFADCPGKMAVKFADYGAKVWANFYFEFGVRKIPRVGLWGGRAARGSGCAETLHSNSHSYRESVVSEYNRPLRERPTLQQLNNHS